MLKAAIFLIFVSMWSLPVGAQEKELLGWDLSYKKLFERNNVNQKTDWMLLYLQDASPAIDWISTWNGKTIISSVLIEYPAFHAGERTTMWFVRTDDAAYYWEIIKDSRPHRNEEDLKPEIYDSFLTEVTSFNQLVAKRENQLPQGRYPGYIGAMSVYDASGSKQILLTMEDFSICHLKVCPPGKGKIGRLLGAWAKVFPESTYKHKSEAEIKRMTPAERIDEEIKLGSHIYDDPGNGRMLTIVRKYRQKDGLKGWQRLVDLIDGYDPKRRKDTRFFSAVMIAENIDSRVVRLRGSAEGKGIVEAIKRLLTHMKAADELDSMVEMVLQTVDGVNDADESVRDTLWVKHRIEMSDNELLEFSNHMVSHDPSYPSWSERRLIKDYSRKNEWGNPLQVFIMTKPARYLQSYRAFKKQKSGH